VFAAVLGLFVVFVEPAALHAQTVSLALDFFGRYLGAGE
jgi:hypothetical protein